MSDHDIVVIGTSSGELDVLRRLVAHLDGDFAASAFNVQNTAPASVGRTSVSEGQTKRIRL